MNNKNYFVFQQRIIRALQKNQSSEKKESLMKRASRLANFFDEHIKNELLNQFSQFSNIPKKVLLQWSLNNYTLELSKIEQLEFFLKSFEIQENEMTKELIILKDNVNYTIDEIILLARENNINTGAIKSFLDTDNKNITVCKKFNPLKKYFEELAKEYNGESQIYKLAQTITAYNFNEPEKTEFYQKRLNYYLHKWLLMAAGQALNITVNNAMLLFIEPLGGSGKSYLIDWLFSMPEIKQYYMKIGENEAFMDFKGMTKSKFIINWDELPLSQKRYLAFKSNIAAQDTQIYNKKTKQFENFKRQVNYIGSTNKANRATQPGYLMDEDSAMFRRIIPVEIAGRIDYNYYLKEIDLKQIWAQAASEIIKAKETNNKKLLSWESDWDDLRKENIKYVDSRNKDIKDIIKQEIKPAQFAEGKFLSAEEIKNHLLKLGYKVPMSYKSIGKFLTFENYKGTKTTKKRGYFVNLKSV